MRWLGVVNFHCMGWACDLFSLMIEKACYVNHFFDIWQWWSRPLNFRVFIHVYSLRPQTYFRLSLTRVLNQFRIWKKQLKSIDIEKVGSKKHLASKSVSFLVELISSSFLNLIVKQARLKASVSGFLFFQWLASSHIVRTHVDSGLVIIRERALKKIFQGCRLVLVEKQHRPGHFPHQPQDN